MMGGDSVGAGKLRWRLLMVLDRLRVGGFLVMGALGGYQGKEEGKVGAWDVRTFGDEKGFQERIAGNVEVVAQMLIGDKLKATMKYPAS